MSAIDPDKLSPGLAFLDVKRREVAAMPTEVWEAIRLAAAASGRYEPTLDELDALIAARDAAAPRMKPQTPASTRRSVASEGRRLCESGCLCVLCHRPTKDLGERVATTGRPAQLKNAREEAVMDARERARANMAKSGRKPRW